MNSNMLGTLTVEDPLMVAFVFPGCSDLSSASSPRKLERMQ